MGNKHRECWRSRVLQRAETTATPVSEIATPVSEIAKPVSEIVKRHPAVAEIAKPGSAIVTCIPCAPCEGVVVRSEGSGYELFTCSGRFLDELSVTGGIGELQPYVDVWMCKSQISSANSPLQRVLMTYAKQRTHIQASICFESRVFVSVPEHGCCVNCWKQFRSEAVCQELVNMVYLILKCKWLEAVAS